MAEYKVPKSAVIFEEEIKKSRFLTYLRRTEGLEQAKAFWKEIRQLHPEARHHCWAAVAGEPDDSQQLGFSDDGEPAGTAGKPMFHVLQGSKIGEISVVVVRYYGGVLLGTGGLVRAYSHGVQQALLSLETEIRVKRRLCRLDCDYAQLNWLKNLCEKYQVEIYRQAFQENITMHLGVQEKCFLSFQLELNERSAGQLCLLSDEN